MKEIIITENEGGQRLDRFLRKFLKDYTLGEIYKLFRKNKVKVNDKKAKENYMLQIGDKLSLYIHGLELQYNKEVKTEDCENNSIDIIYEDENLLLINKPAGLLTHPDSSKDKDTLINRAIGYLTKTGQYNISQHKTFAPSVCNRLDRNTGGIVIVAKNYKSLKLINELIRERKMGKFYLCIAKGRTPQRGEMKDFILKNEKNNKVSILKEENEKSKAIHTVFRTVKTISDYSLVEVELITGRPHQIRAHFASIGNPLIGDQKYGDVKVNKFFRDKYDLRHQFLYAYKLSFDEMKGHLEYLNGKTFKCSLPDKLNKIVNELFNI